MLTLSSARRPRLGNGISRRDLLRIGTLSVGGLSLADLLRLKAKGAQQAKTPHKAVIMIYLCGAPFHIDTYDMKPVAPAESYPFASGRASRFRRSFRGPLKTQVQFHTMPASI